MDGSTGILTENSAVEKAHKVEENMELDLFDSIGMDLSEADAVERSAEPEAQPHVDNDLVGKDAETANVYQTDRVRIVIDPSRDAKLTAFGKETLEDRYLLNDEKGSPQKLFARVACHYADDSAHADVQERLLTKLLTDWDPDDLDRRIRASQRDRLLIAAGNSVHGIPAWKPGSD